MKLLKSKFIRGITLTLSCVLPITSVVYPARSTERIELSYRFLSGSIPLQSLETYLCTGRIDNEAADSVCRINSNQLTKLRQLLSIKIPLNSVAVSQFLHTSIGEKLLTRIGRVIQIEGYVSRVDALRSAIVLAAQQPQGFTPLEVLRQLPAQSTYINLQEALALAGETYQFVDQTHDANTAVHQKAMREAQSPFDISSAEDLRQPGRFTWQKQTLTLNDPERDRQIPTDLYLPQSKARHPIVVISHGLGSDRHSFSYLAEHLASYGFAVAVPEHPGSNSKQLAALLTGKAREITSPREFVNRPIDVSKLLNKLEQLSRTNQNFQGRLDLQTVGIVGHSFGGYTALAVSGATLQAQHLKTICQTQNSLNLSLLLQCGATQIPQLPSRLSDPRIKATIAINPFSSAIFGQSGLSQIKVPTMIVASSADTMAPALSEQIQPFTWLKTPDKYLALMTGATHFSAVGSSPNDAVPVLPSIVGANPALAHQYIDALSTAFLKTHLMKQPRYRSYLSADYAKAISQSNIQVAFVKTLSASELSQDLDGRLSLFLGVFCLYLYSLSSGCKIRQVVRRNRRLHLSNSELML